MKRGVVIDVDCQVGGHDLQKLQQCSTCDMSGCLKCYQSCVTCPQIVCPMCILKSNCQGTLCDGRCKKCIGPVTQYLICLASDRVYKMTGCVHCVNLWERDTESYLHCQRKCEECELDRPRFCLMDTCNEVFCPHKDENRTLCDEHKK
jgi:hypothetical protein